MRILHLYHDVMNLYGEYGNVRAMERILSRSGEEVSVDRVTLGGEAKLADFDFIYIGSGTEKKQKQVLEDFKKYSAQLREAVEAGKVILLTGNSFEMLGKTLTDAQGRVYDGLGLYPFTSVEQNKTRDTADAVADADFLEKPLVGFINKCSEIHGISDPMLTLRRGLGNINSEKGEGMRERNLFMTHMTGPVLVKNPHFLEYLAAIMLGRQPDVSAFENERKGYEVTLTELSRDI